MYVLLDVRRFSMEHVVSFDVSHVYRAIREVYQVHLYVFFFSFFFSLSLSLCLSISYALSLSNVQRVITKVECFND